MDEKMEKLGALMVKHGVVLRAVPEKIRHIYETVHAGKFPGGHIEQPAGYNREMWVVEEVPAHAGQFLLAKATGMSSTVKFSADRYFQSMGEVLAALDSM